jgi:hypothetical protein
MIATNIQNHGDSGSLSILMFMFPDIRFTYPKLWRYLEGGFCLVNGWNV